MSAGNLLCQTQKKNIFFPSLSLRFIQLDGKKLYLLQEDNGLIFNPDPHPWKVASSSGAFAEWGKAVREK